MIIFLWVLVSRGLYLPQTNSSLLSEIHTSLLFTLGFFRVAYAANISEHLTIRLEIDHHTGNYVPYSFRTVCGFFYVPQN